MIDFTEFKKRVHETKHERISRDVLYRFVRSVSVRISYGLLKLVPGIRANHVSITVIILVLVSLGLTLFQARNPQLIVVIQLVLLQIAAIGDRVDGEVARYQQFFTQKGIYYDRMFHFLFPFALYISVGNFFAVESSFYTLVVIGCVLAALASLANILGKLRHHIGYKIKLEGHETLIQDYREAGDMRTNPGMLRRIGTYAIFMMYDWVWTGYLLLVLAFHLMPFSVSVIYFVHAAVSLICLLYYILIEYPRVGLFAREDLVKPDHVHSDSHSHSHE